MPLATAFRSHALGITTVGLIAVATVRLGLAPELPAVVAFIVGGLMLAVIDWRVQRLPTQLVYATLAGVTAGLVFASVVEWQWRPMAGAVAGSLLAANAYLFVWWITGRMTGLSLIGFGDVRLAAVIGMLLGWYGLAYVLSGALAGHLLALVMAAVISVRRRRIVLRYAFGPPLLAGAFAVVLVQAA